METVQVKCVVEEPRDMTDHWVEYDVRKWTTARYFRDIAGGNKTETLPVWLEPYSVDWHIVGVDGEPVPHPGAMPDFDSMSDSEQQQARVVWQDAWSDAWDQVPLDVVNWLTITAYLAMSEVMAASNKRVPKRKSRRAKGRKTKSTS